LLGPKLPSVRKFTNKSIGGQNSTWRLKEFDLREEIIKTGWIYEVLKKKGLLLVQILKEPISTKGRRLTCEITIPGRLLVLVPYSNIVTISKKVRDTEERKRITLLIDSIKPANFAVILRTAAEGKKAADLHEDMSELLENWKKMFTIMSEHKKIGK